jgi:hypothetical protein
VSTDLQSGPSAALKVFVIGCFVVWIAASYMALFALATVFWVAWLESRVHPGAFVQYNATLAITIASAVGSLWLWKRVHDRPWLYMRAAKGFAAVIALAAAVGATAAIWHLFAH